MPETVWNPIEALSDEKREKLDAYASLLERYNQRINLISRESVRDLRVQHLVHCLSIAYRSFPAGASVVDWGTGGGLPAIPLAIAFPEVDVYAVDSVGKKVRAVRTFARRLDLDNCFPWEGRAENWTGSAHYSVSRATAPLADLWRWHRRVAHAPSDPVPADAWTPGLVCLKGGDLTEEIAALHAEDSDVMVRQRALSSLFGGHDFFAEKKLVVVSRLDEEPAEEPDRAP
jgi:16S rRNA (guanine527-N7)-methyltransferase